MTLKPSDFGGLYFLRVVVVGANGAGKTWFARDLAARMRIPVVTKDAIALTTGWQQRPRAQVQTALADAIKAEAWVLEGGPSILSPVVLDRADLVIWLDLPASVRFWRIVRRSLRYLGRTRPEHPPGNRDWPGRRQFGFAWRALVGGDQFVRAINGALAGSAVPLVRLRTPAEAAAFLKG